MTATAAPAWPSTGEAVALGDGAAIEMRVFAPPSGVPPLAAVLIASAMGVRQAFYAPFALWLARQGYLVATFDYRGVGASRVAPLRGFDADLFSWARDFDAALDALALRAEGHPIFLVGHSLGAQLPGLLRNRDRIDGLVSIAAGSGYWRDNAPRLKRSVLYFWYLLVPIATALFGYFPGARLKKVGDLPRGVVLQWRRWCLDPRYHVGAEGRVVREQFESVRFPLVAVSISDDEMMTERGIRVLVDCYANAPRRVERIAPADVAAKRIGHFGFFRDAFEHTLWTRAAAWLLEFQRAKEAT
jgi:predicted alpha/beta hydrolase